MTAVFRRRWLRRHTAAVVAVGTLLSATLLVIGAVFAPSEAAEFYPAPASGAYTIDGRGFGHGHGMSQWGTQGAALQGLDVHQIMAFYYPGTVETQIGNPLIRVQLSATSSGDIKLESTGGGGMNVTDAASGASAAGPAGTYRVITSGARQSILRLSGSAWTPFSLGGDGTYAGPIQFGSADGVTVFQNDGVARNYRGAIQVARTAAATSAAVNHVYMEDYLKGVVPRESPASWLPAALQSQAVAARSYAWWDAQTPSSAGPWDICDTTACQVYGGRQYRDAGSSTWKAEEYSSSSAPSTARPVSRCTTGASRRSPSSARPTVGRVLRGPSPIRGVHRPVRRRLTDNSVHQWKATLTVATLEAAAPGIGTFTGLRIVSREGRGLWGGYIESVDLVGTGAR